MRIFATTLALWLVGAVPALHAAGDGPHTLPFSAPVLVDLGFFKITNSMVAMWIVAAIVILVAQLATRRISLVPTGLQNFFETVVEGLQDFLPRSWVKSWPAKHSGFSDPSSFSS
jgi:F-type H+-transporting ATPase subunit a